jgi:hypothetical protein
LLLLLLLLALLGDGWPLLLLVVCLLCIRPLAILLRLAGHVAAG